MSCLASPPVGSVLFEYRLKGTCHELSVQLRFSFTVGLGILLESLTGGAVGEEARSEHVCCDSGTGLSVWERQTETLGCKWWAEYGHLGWRVAPRNLEEFSSTPPCTAVWTVTPARCRATIVRGSGSQGSMLSFHWSRRLACATLIASILSCPFALWSACWSCLVFNLGSLADVGGKEHLGGQHRKWLSLVAWVFCKSNRHRKDWFEPRSGCRSRTAEFVYE